MNFSYAFLFLGTFMLCNTVESFQLSQVVHRHTLNVRHDLVSTTFRIGNTPLPLRMVSADAESALTVAEANSLLIQACETKDVEPDLVLDSIMFLEKEQRRRRRENPKSDGEESGDLQKVSGNWQLVFTTGDKKTEKNFGRINYFPVKAVQCFDASNMQITNGIYIGDFSVLLFSGEFVWIDEKTRLEFDFNKVKVGPFEFGFGSKDPPKVQPSFNFIAIEEKIIVARGAGGGLALWKRV
mmetsp:Transcript_23602/g.30607  ORF Transcript_23602/g.30607 Transcript_23602/m.30607 type:complete len:240 (+) Transcript_23602:112-831(+)